VTLYYGNWIVRTIIETNKQLNFVEVWKFTSSLQRTSTVRLKPFKKTSQFADENHRVGERRSKTFEVDRSIGEPKTGANRPPPGVRHD